MIRVVCVAVGLAACSSAAQPLATAEPGVIYSYPANEQRDVPVGARIVVAFSDPVTPGALGACAGTGDAVTGAFCVVGPDGSLDATPEVVGDGRTVSLEAAALAPGVTYAVYVRGALAPTARNLPASGPLFRFTTRSTQARAAAPTVIAINGGDPAQPDGFRPMFDSSTIRLVFSEPLDPRTVALEAGAIELVDAAGKLVPATILASGIHVVIDPIADLSSGQAYQVRVGGRLADLGGQRVVPAEFRLAPRATGADRAIPERLRTRGAADRGPASARTGGERNLIVIDKPLIGRELAPMMPSVLAAELGDPKALDGPIAFTIRRGQRLRAAGLDVKLSGEIAIGLATGEVWIELLTDAGGRLYRNPYQPATQRPENARAPLLVDLSMDLAVYATDPTGNAALTQTVLGVQASGVVTATDGVLDLEAVIAMDLQLLGVARAPTNLVLELITDPGAALDVDQTPPTLVATLPAAAGELAVDAGVELIFSEPIDLDRARAGGVRLETSAGQPVASVIESHGAAVVIRPVAPLASSISYRVTLGDVADRAGNKLAGAQGMTFTTPALAATDAPLTVAAVHPGVPCTLVGGGATSPGRCAGGAASDDRYRPFALAAGEPVRVTFTQPPVPASVTHGTACNTGSVRIEQLDGAGACVAAVAGAFQLRDRTIAFEPETAWRAGTRYRLTLISGGNRSCNAGELCGISGSAASFDPLAGSSNDDGGGPDLVIEFVGAAPNAATLLFTEAAPFTDGNGSGKLEGGERLRDDNRVALRITGTTGAVSSASFAGGDCVPGTPQKEACMYLSGAMPVELLPLTHSCPLPGGEAAASCVPIVLTSQVMYATSITIDATLVIPVSTDTGLSVMRLREPRGGPIIGHLFDDRGTLTLVVALELYLDAPDMSVPLSSHDLRSKPLSVVLRGPLRFLPDGRIAIAVANVADVPVKVTIDAPLGVTGAVEMILPRGELKLQLVSPALRGALP
jgi:hypothetical protein